MPGSSGTANVGAYAVVYGTIPGYGDWLRLDDMPPAYYSSRIRMLLSSEWLPQFRIDRTCT